MESALRRLAWMSRTWGMSRPTTSRVRCRTLLCESRARARMRVLNMIDKRVYSERKQRTKRERFVDMDFVRPRDVEMLDASS